MNAVWKSIKILAVVTVCVLFSTNAAHAIAATSELCEGLYGLIYVVDGIPNDLFRRMLNEGDLPNFERHTSMSEESIRNIT